jgi:5-methylcytosine-specific restriction endonuclease McrA
MPKRTKRHDPMGRAVARYKPPGMETPRAKTADRGYGSKWQTARRQYLADNPLCVECHAQGRIKAAQVVDHIQPHKGDQKLFWRRSNWQALCKFHHDRKTATRDGGFGRGGEVERFSGSAV